MLTLAFFCPALVPTCLARLYHANDGADDELCALLRHWVVLLVSRGVVHVSKSRRMSSPSTKKSDVCVRCDLKAPSSVQHKIRRMELVKPTPDGVVFYHATELGCVGWVD